MLNFKMIGIGCTALAGKDTLFSILDDMFPNKLYRVALADPLKSELNDFLVKNYGISAFTKNPEEKTLIRPMFVEHGKIKRIQSKGKYWTSLAQERVNDILYENMIPVCTDIRYAVYREDEIHWLKSINNGIYIHINRFDKDGSKVEAANSEEKAQEVILEKFADIRLNWPTSDDRNYLIDIVKKQLSPVISAITLKNGNI